MALLKSTSRHDVLQKLQNPAEVLTADDVAVWLGVSRRTVRDAIAVRADFPRPIIATEKRSCLKWSAAALVRWAGLGGQV